MNGTEMEAPRVMPRESRCVRRFGFAENAVSHPVGALVSLLAVCLALLATARDASGGQLKSLQTGTVTVSNGLPLVVLLPTAVDATKAFVVFGAGENTANPWTDRSPPSSRHRLP